MKEYILVDGGGDFRDDILDTIGAKNSREAIDKIIDILQDGDEVYSYIPDYDLDEIHQVEGDDVENYRVWYVCELKDYFNF